MAAEELVCFVPNCKGTYWVGPYTSIYWKVLDEWLKASSVKGHFKRANSCLVSPQIAMLSLGGELN